MNYFRTATGKTFHTVGTNNEAPDETVITPDMLKAKISDYCDLNETQRDKLLAVLMKYQSHLTKRPDKSKRFEYHFNVVGKLHKATSLRTI